MKEDRFSDALYFAVKDTLVANDIKEATTVAFNSPDNKKYRVVTLKGEMCEMTGVMSGGGKPKQGAMGNKIVEEYSEEQIRSVRTKIEHTD